MSMEARDRFADGFPFLLAPLAQLKGFVPKKETISGETPVSKRKKSGKGFLEGVSTRTDDAISWVQGNVNGGISNVNAAFHHCNTATQNIGSNLQNFGSEMDKRRDLFWSQIVHSQQRSARMILSRVPYINKNLEVFDHDTLVAKRLDAEVLSNPIRSNVFKPQIAKLLENFNKQRPISDEIGVIIEPTMNFTHMMFLYLVHFYLVLLLIVSVPDSSTTRLVVKRSSDSTLDSDSDHEERCKQLSLDYKEFSCPEEMGPWSGVPGAIPRFVVEKNGVEQNSVDGLSATSEEHETSIEHDELSGSTRQPIQKSLSYFL
jgi:hypothetical protein